MKASGSNKGFTLVELMIVVALFALFLVMATPSIRIYLENTKIRNVAESIATGMQKARAHAIRTNKSTEFSLTITGGVAVGWTIWELNETVTPIVQVNPAVETFTWGAGGHNWTTVTATPNAGLTRATFNGLGRLLPQNLSAPTNLPPSNITVVGTLAGTRQLRVDVATGTGGIRVCDPGLPTGDPKSCN